MALNKLEGIFTPLLVPVDDRGQINEPELRRFVSWLIDRGVHGLYPNGSTGEFTRFTTEERRRIAQVVTDETSGRVPILAGAAEANVKETLAACEAYARMGVRAVAIVAPFYYKLTPESVYAYFAEIARNSPIDLTLYNIPDVRQPHRRAYHPAAGGEFPRVIGIKDSSGRRGLHDAHDHRRAPEAAGFLVPHRLGSRAGPHADDRLRRRHARYQQRRAGSHPPHVRSCASAAITPKPCNGSSGILELFDAMLYPFEFPDGFRAAAELRGFQFGRGRQPQTSAQRADRQTLSSMSAVHPGGFRAGGPARERLPRAHRADRAATSWSRWFSNVMHELEKRGVV